MTHYIYSYDRNQLIEFLDDPSLNDLSTEELRNIAIEQLKNDDYSSFND